MPRRVNLPGADELFGKQSGGTDARPPVAPSRRGHHDEKITVYLSTEDLVAIEQARLRLKAEFGIRVDRGRLVREATALVLADLEASGVNSILVRQLS